MFDEMSFQYSDIFEILAEKHDISSAKDISFKGRVQHFQRLGFPTGINTGKGVKAKYGWRELFLLGLAFEYIEIGSTPERCIAEICKFEDLILEALAKLTSPPIDRQEPCFLITQLSGLLALKRQKHWAEELELLNEQDMARIFSDTGDDRYRSPYAIIDLRQFLSAILMAVFEISTLKEREILDLLGTWSRSIRLVQAPNSQPKNLDLTVA